MNATKYYSPAFFGGPFNRLYTYDYETKELLNVYKDASQTEQHSNPIVFDEFGYEDIYIDTSKVYLYKLYNKEGELIYESGGIKQTRGKDGDPNSTVVGPDGKKGRIGPQGVSTVGPDGPQGPQGNDGRPFNQRVFAKSNEALIIPAGVDAIYITATAGGGSAAAWSPYSFAYMHINRNAPDSGDKGVESKTKRKSDGVMLDSPWINYFSQEVNIYAFTLIPGSGFSGQSKYMHKVEIADTSKTHTLIAIIGNGGIFNKNLDTCNGVNGGKTEVYLDDKLVLSLAGGLGGENQFPKSDPEKFSMRQILSENKGFNTGYIVSNMTGNSDVNLYADRFTVFDTTYKAKDNIGLFKDVAIEVSLGILSQPLYYAPKGFESQNLRYSENYSMITSNNFNNIDGDNNIFGSMNLNYYSGTATDSFIIERRKDDISGNGAGAGGNTFWYNVSDYASFQRENYSADFRLQSDSILYSNNYIEPLNYTYFYNRIKTFCETFMLDDSYGPGITIPDAKIQEWYDEYKSRHVSNRYAFINDGIQNILTVVGNEKNLGGGNGVDGFCVVEYGGIIEH